MFRCFWSEINVVTVFAENSFERGSTIRGSDDRYRGPCACTTAKCNLERFKFMFVNIYAIRRLLIAKGTVQLSKKLFRRESRAPRLSPRSMGKCNLNPPAYIRDFNLPLLISWDGKSRRRTSKVISRGNGSPPFGEAESAAPELDRRGIGSLSTAALCRWPPAAQCRRPEMVFRARPSWSPHRRESRG